ncbi:DNA-directed RNA polymerase subunit RPB6 [uncultured virus]|nr:DNA-directed RNA polymerase subunit RPB6 [uncultured virus]
MKRINKKIVKKPTDDKKKDQKKQLPKNDPSEDNESTDSFELNSDSEPEVENIEEIEENQDDEIDNEDDLNDNVEIDDEDKDMQIVDDKSIDEKEIEENDEDKCLYNYAKENSDDEDEIELVFDDDKEEIKNMELVQNENRITKPYLTKYERVRLIGDRARQLSLGAKPMIKNVESLTSKEIAELEIKNNVIPLYILRPLPNGKKEKWYIGELSH